MIRGMGKGAYTEEAYQKCKGNGTVLENYPPNTWYLRTNLPSPEHGGKENQYSKQFQASNQHQEG